MRAFRRVPLVAATAVALLAAGSATAIAAWSRTATIPAVSITSGDMALVASWTTTPDLTGLLPGATRSGVARLKHSGDGRWQLRLPSSTGTDAMSGLTVAYTTSNGAGSCSTTSIATDTWGATQPNGSTVYVCVTFTLAPNAPSSVQSTPAAISVVAQARNQPTT